MSRIKTLLLLIALLCVLSPTAAAGTEDGLPVAVNEKNAAALLKIFQAADADLAKNPADVEAAKRAGVAAHQLALLSEKGYAERAVQALAAVTAREPDNAVFLAYLGSSYALMGREGGVVMQKISNVNKGLSLLNRAVKKTPDNFIVRMVRGSVTYELPDMFKQKETAFEDFSFVAGRFADMPGLDGELKAEVYYKLGRLADDKGDSAARSVFFFKAAEAAPESPWAQRAKKE